MTLFEIVFVLFAGIVLVTAVPYTVGRWAARGVMEAALDLMQKLEQDCDNPNCQHHKKS